MAAGYLARPGEKAGPCLDRGCNHIDCAETRRQAESPCTICGEPIGYDRAHYIVDDGRLAHAVCVERDAGNH